jgi:molybdopterin-guanine dinucleotide biosynthesis protein MobB
MNRADWVFHPFELAFVGYKNSGKTTLLAALTARLGASGLRVGYLKHDAHGFQMDRAGKDTDVLAAAGADLVAISDQDHQALLRTAPRSPIQDLDLLEPDVLLVEGHKHLRLPRVALLDPAGAILADPALREHPPLAVVHPGACPDLPWDVPRFHRDDQDGIHRFVQATWAARAAKVPLHGLVLTGGLSVRMGRDKAQLETGGRSQADRTFRLLEAFCAQVFISCRREQADWPGRRGRPQIHDILLDHGPVGGILSAFHDSPMAAWLVLACDLPCLGEATLRRLVRGRNPFRFATAFRGHGSHPEPLCTIYEPKSRARLWQGLAAGRPCPSDLLALSPVALLEGAESDLRDVDTPEELKAAKRVAGR